MTRSRMIVAAAVFAMMALSVAQAADKKVLFVDSYHEGYAWSDGVTKGVKKVIGDKAELKIHRMDTKRNNSEEDKVAAAEAAKKVIEDWKPDVVIASDDNASKFLIAKHYKDADLPFVFCGVNWDASGYGFPCKNVTGMTEVSLVPQALKALEGVAEGKKVGQLGPDIDTAKKEAANIKKTFDMELTEYYAKDFDDWKKGLKELQEKCDIVIIASDGGLYKEKADEMKAFCEANTTKPTVSFYDFMAPYALLSYCKSAEEQGEYAAATALKILDGTSPKDIPVKPNTKADVIVNAAIMKNIGKPLPMEIIENATVLK